MEKKEAGQAYIGLYIDSAPLMRQADTLRGRLQGVFDEVGASAARRFTGRAESVRRAMEQWERQSGRLRDSFSELSSVMGQSFAVALTPAMTALNGFISSILSAARTFRSFIFSLFGKKAEDTVSDTASALDGVGSSAGGAGRRISAAAKEARRALMAFDQINRLDEDTDGGGGSGSGGSGGMNIADLWGSGEDIIQGNPFGELLRRMIDEGDYYGAGAALAAKLGEIVDTLDGKITDPVFRNKLKGALSGITEGINGFFAGMTFREDDKQTVAERLGDFVGDAVGLGLSSIHTLLSGIDWSTIGVSIAQFVNGGIASLRSQDTNFGTVLADWINMKIGTLSGIFAELDWAQIGVCVGENINALFEDIDWDTAAQTFVDGVTGLCELIESTLKTIQFADIISDISSAIFGALFGEEGEQWLREHPFWSKLLFGSDTPYTAEGGQASSVVGSGGSGTGSAGTAVNEDNLIPGVTYTDSVPYTGDDTGGFLGDLAGKLTSWLSGDGKLSLKAEVTDVTDKIPAEKKEFSHFSGKFETAEDDIPLKDKILGSWRAALQSAEDSIPDDQKTIGSIADFVKSHDGMTWAQTTFGSIANFKYSKDGMTWDQTTFGSVAKFVRAKDKLTWNQTTIGSVAKFVRAKDGLTWDQATIGSRANFVRSQDGLTWDQTTFGSKAKFVASEDYLSWEQVTFESVARVSHIEVPEWVLSDLQNKIDAKVKYSASGGAYYGGSWHSIPQYAGGTANAHGSMFIAGEAGPEVVGHIGGRTEVLNRSQLASTMHSAVISGMGAALGNLAAWITPPLAMIGRSVSRSEEHLASMDSQMRSGAAGGGPELMGLLRQIVTLIREIDTNAYLDGADVTDQVVKHLNARTRATGVCELIV